MSSRLGVFLLAVALLLGGAAGIAAGRLTVQSSPVPSLGPATSETVNPEREAMTSGEEAAYDRGFGDGVEYQSWFTCNQLAS